MNTENQIASAKAVREVLNNDKDVYDPRKYLGPAREAIKETVKGKIREFGTSIALNNLNIFVIGH